MKNEICRVFSQRGAVRCPLSRPTARPTSAPRPTRSGRPASTAVIRVTGWPRRVSSSSSVRWRRSRTAVIPPSSGTIFPRPAPVCAAFIRHVALFPFLFLPRVGTVYRYFYFLNTSSFLEIFFLLKSAEASGPTS